MKGERPECGGLYWPYSRKVWGFSLVSLEEIYPGCLQKPEQPAFHLLLFLGSDKGVSQEERGLFPQAENLAAP